MSLKLATAGLPDSLFPPKTKAGCRRRVKAGTGLRRKDNICRVWHASAAKHVAADPQRSRTVARVAALMALRLSAQPGHRSQVWNALSDSPASCGSGLARDSLGRTRTTRPSATPYLSPNGSRREDGANEAR